MDKNNQHETPQGMPPPDATQQHANELADFAAIKQGFEATVQGLTPPKFLWDTIDQALQADVPTDAPDAFSSIKDGFEDRFQVQHAPPFAWDALEQKAQEPPETYSAIKQSFERQYSSMVVPLFSWEELTQRMDQEATQPETPENYSRVRKGFVWVHTGQQPSAQIWQNILRQLHPRTAWWLQHRQTVGQVILVLGLLGALTWSLNRSQNTSPLLANTTTTTTATTNTNTTTTSTSLPTTESAEAPLALGQQSNATPWVAGLPLQGILLPPNWAPINPALALNGVTTTTAMRPNALETTTAAEAQTSEAPALATNLQNTQTTASNTTTAAPSTNPTASLNRPVEEGTNNTPPATTTTGTAEENPAEAVLALAPTVEPSGTLNWQGTLAQQNAAQHPAQVEEEATSETLAAHWQDQLSSKAQTYLDDHSFPTTRKALRGKRLHIEVGGIARLGTSLLVRPRDRWNNESDRRFMLSSALGVVGQIYLSKNDAFIVTGYPYAVARHTLKEIEHEDGSKQRTDVEFGFAELALGYQRVLWNYSLIGEAPSRVYGRFDFGVAWLTRSSTQVNHDPRHRAAWYTNLQYTAGLSLGTSHTIGRVVLDYGITGNLGLNSIVSPHHPSLQSPTRLFQTGGYVSVRYLLLPRLAPSKQMRQFDWSPPFYIEEPSY